jgi:hypothetical protein
VDTLERDERLFLEELNMLRFWRSKLKFDFVGAMILLAGLSAAVAIISFHYGGKF